MKALTNKLSSLFCWIFISVLCYGCGKGDLPIIHETFENLDNWVVEQIDGGVTSVSNGKLEIDDLSGCTVWYKHELEAPFIIEYDATVIDDGGPNDRVSDLNCFWLAEDMKSPENFFRFSKVRGGKFQNYHNLRLYYVGLGGHNNTKTRFRKYDGKGNRPILPEHDLFEKKYLIEANKTNHIKIVVDRNTVQYYYNGMLVYDIDDPAPYKKGYFGFRTYKNHMQVDDFKVFRIIKN